MIRTTKNSKKMKYAACDIIKEAGLSWQGIACVAEHVDKGQLSYDLICGADGRRRYFVTVDRIGRNALTKNLRKHMGVKKASSAVSKVQGQKIALKTRKQVREICDNAAEQLAKTSYARVYRHLYDSFRKTTGIDLIESNRLECAESKQYQTVLEYATKHNHLAELHKLAEEKLGKLAKGFAIAK